MMRKFTKLYRRHKRKGGGGGGEGGGGMVVADQTDHNMESSHHLRVKPRASTFILSGHAMTIYILLPMLLCWALVDQAQAQTCPAPPSSYCTCEVNNGKQIINCRRRDPPLTEVPAWRQGSSFPFFELTLAHNNIQALRDNAFNGLNIKRLDLSENPITLIESGAFNGLEANLEELVLHVDRMNTFPKEALAKLVSLRLLYVKGFNTPTLPENALQTLSQLRSLTIDNCKLSSLTSDDLRPLRTTLNKLALPYNEFTSVPSSALYQMNNLQEFDIQHNKINVLGSGFLSENLNIKSLDFSNNEIDTITPGAFRGLEGTLNNLVLKSNKLTDNQLLPMGKLQNLETLNLAINSLRNIHPQALIEMQKLRFLNMRSNNIETLRRDSLDPVKNSLVYLELPENGIKSIEPGMFVGFSKLEEIHLDDQHSSLTGVLAENTFQGLEGSLKRLGLGRVGFTQNNFNSIKNLGKLEWLALRDNNIQTIPEMTFQHHTQLKTLDMSNNSINTLSQKELHIMKSSLVEINLMKNQIQSLSQCVFNEHTSLLRIKLGSNPLRCDCDLVWISKWIETFKNDPIRFFQIDWKCQSPDNLRDRRFRDLAGGDLCATDPPEERCEVIIVTTTPNPSNPSAPSVAPISTTLSPLSLVINITDITPDSALVRWSIQDPGITGFAVQHSIKEGTNQVGQVVLDARVKQHRLTKLQSGTEYTTCVTSLYENPNLDTKTCSDFQTLKTPAKQTQGGANVGAIVGGLIGALAIIALLIILGFLLVRFRGDGGGGSWLSMLKFGKGRGAADTTKKSRTPTGLPQMGYNSKRFSRPREGREGATASTTSSQLNQQQNESNYDLEKKLAGFSEEERDRIMNILTTTGGSTASIISSGSSSRYVPELPPRPQSLEGYLNPQLVKDEYDDPDNHIYSEIPAAGAYYEEPRSSLTRDSGISTTSAKYYPYPDPNANSGPASNECYI